MAIAVHPIALGEQHVFELRRDPGGAVLAQLVLVTREVNPLHEKLIEWARPRIPLKQAIYDLRIEPGVETVRARFRTRQPTAPILAVRHEPVGELAGSALGRNATVHDIEVPISRDPTPQNEVYKLGVAALSTEGVPTTAEATALFRTGSRQASVFFDRFRVHNDGDPGWYLARGDFELELGAGEIGMDAPFDEDRASPTRSVTASTACSTAPRTSTPRRRASGCRRCSKRTTTG